jgi:hypothetical protein
VNPADVADASVISIKSRLIPFDFRPDPPLLAPTSLLNAYNHARHPESFDKVAEQREKDAAKSRIDNKHSDEDSQRTAGATNAVGIQQHASDTRCCILGRQK